MVTLVIRLGLASGHLLTDRFSVQGLFNTIADARVSLPGQLLLKRGRAHELEMPLFNPTLLFANHSIFSSAGNAPAYNEVRGHPLAKLASMLNQLFGITVVADLNMMAELLAIGSNFPIEEINAMGNESMIALVAGRIDVHLRHVVFATNFRFLRFEKADNL